MSTTPEQEATIYLDAQERQVWDALVAILVRLPAALDAQLRLSLIHI